MDWVGCCWIGSGLGLLRGAWNLSVLVAGLDGRYGGLEPVGVRVWLDAVCALSRGVWGQPC